ncbi:MAG: CAP domain-containing protein [bacterium]|nr:CAP domain-containing protein [bacterium]
MKQILDTIHHFFIPRHSNNFKAKLLHHDVLTSYLIFALALTISINVIQDKSGSILGYATDISPTKLFELTNVEREEAQLPSLTYNQALADAAEQKALNIFENNYWAHYGPNGETPWEFILEAGYQYEYAGENLAKNFLFSEGVVKAWMDSETHRENIMRDEYTEVGFAVVNGLLENEETTLVVQMFGAPLYPTNNIQAEDPKPTAQVMSEAATKIQKVLANSNKPLFFPLYLQGSALFIAFLIITLILDFYFASKLGLIHIKGKHLAHILFLGFVLVGAYIIINGAIL